MDGHLSIVVREQEDLKFMDVTSLRVLVSSHQQAQQSTKRLVLVNVGAQVRRLMILTRLIDVLSVLEGPVELPQSSLRLRFLLTGAGVGQPASGHTQWRSREGRGSPSIGGIGPS